MTDTRTVTPSVAKALIVHAMKVGRPAFIWGGPGIGKSQLIAEIGAESGRPVIDVRLLLLEPTDIKGLPYFSPESKKMEWAPPVELPTDPTSNAILFLDELNAAPQSVQAAAYQLILDRRVGNYVLPKGVSIVAAGNRESDRGVTFRMPSPLANRFVHVEMAPDFQDWQKWALKSGVHADVVGYLSFAKQDLYDFNPKSSSRAFATPRSWVYVSQLIDDALPDLLISELVAGSVGEGLSYKFMEHRRVASKMPNPTDILHGKVQTLQVKEISAMYTLTISMCYELKDELSKTKDKGVWHEYVNNFLNFMMDNFETEMVVMGAKIALRDFALPIEHRKVASFKKFYEGYGKYVLD